MSANIQEANYESKARASPRGEVCRKPATAVRGEEHEGQSRLAPLGRAGTTPQSPVNPGGGEMLRLGTDPSRSSPGRAPSRPGKWRATAMD
jgi:hypothetical protein